MWTTAWTGMWTDMWTPILEDSGRIIPFNWLNRYAYSVYWFKIQLTSESPDWSVSFIPTPNWFNPEGVGTNQTLKQVLLYY